MTRQKESKNQPPSKFGGIDVDVIAGEVNLYRYNHPNKSINFWTVHEALCLANDAFKKSGVTQDELEFFYNKYHTPEWDEMWAVNRIQMITVRERELMALVDWKGFPASDPRSAENWLSLDGLHPRYIDDYCKRNATSISSIVKDMGRLSKSAALKAWEFIKDTNVGKEMAQSGKYGVINSLVDSISSTQALQEPKPKKTKGMSTNGSQTSLHLEDLVTKGTSNSSVKPHFSSTLDVSSQDDIEDSEDLDKEIKSPPKYQSSAKEQKNTKESNNTREQKGAKEQTNAKSGNNTKEQKNVKNQKGQRAQKERSSYDPVSVAIDDALTGTCKVGSDKLPIEKDLSNRIREVLTMIEAKACRIAIKNLSKTSSDDAEDTSIVFTHVVNDGLVKKRSVALSLEEVTTDCNVAVYVLREFIKKSTVK